MKNKVLNTIVLIVVSIVMGYFFIYLHGLENLINQLEYMKINWIIISFGTFVLFWIFETFVFKIIFGILYDKPMKFRTYFRYILIGQFFGAVTPFSSGSQPSQVLAMNEDGIPMEISASILAIKFIIHELVYFIFLIISLAIKFSYFNEKIDYFYEFCVVGVAINLVIISMAILMSFTVKAPKKIMLIIYKIMKIFRIMKNYEENCNNLDNKILNFHKHATLILQYKKECFIAMILTAAQWMAYYIIPYFIYRSFSMNEVSILTMITAQVFLTMFMSCIPIPGAEGGAEAGFYVIYRLFFSKSNLVPAIFIWRIITYYFTILFGGVFTIIIPKKIKKAKIME